MSSALLQSSFDKYGNHVAYVVQSLDTESVKVLSTAEEADSSVIVRSLGKDAKVRNLQWISADTIMISFANSDKAELLNYASNEVTATLRTDQLAVCDCVGGPMQTKVYVLTSNNCIKCYKLDQSLTDWTLENSVTLETDLTGVVKMIDYDANYLLLFSNSVYLFDKRTGKICDSKNLYVTKVDSVILGESQTGKIIMVSASNDRFINILKLEDGKVISGKEILVTENPVIKIDHYCSTNPKMEVLVSLTEGGVIEVFNDPFGEHQDLADSKRRRRRRGPAVQSRHSDGKLKLFRKNATASGEKVAIPVGDFRLGEKYLTISWVEDSSYLAFNNLGWWKSSGKETSYGITSNEIIYKERPVVGIVKAGDKYGHDIASAKRYRESEAIVSTGNELTDLDRENEQEDFATLAKEIQASNEGPKRGRKKFQVGSLTTVLTQALKSNDHGLLDTILNNNRDETVIKTTISRLDSTYVLTLLDRLSERMLRGKAARNRQMYEHLSTWVNYILVYHGSFLIHLPNLNADLGLLSSSLRARSRNLDRLLQLKGKFHMLDDCISARRFLEQGPATDMMKADNKNQEEAAVEYVEAVDDAGLESDDDEEDEEEISGNEIEEDADEPEEPDEQSEDESDEGGNLSDAEN